MPEPRQILQSDREPDLLLGFASRVGERFAGSEMPANGNVERARPRVLRLRAPLEEGEQPPRLVDAADPDVQRTVPVAVAVDILAELPNAGGTTVLVEDVEGIVLGIGRAVQAGQKRSSTCSRAPSAMSCSVSSLRPGRTSRCTMPRSSSRYWPTQSSRGE